MFGLFEKKKHRQTCFIVERIETPVDSTAAKYMESWEVWFRKDGVETQFLTNIRYQSTINGLVLQAVRHEDDVGDGREIVVVDDTGGYRSYIDKLVETGIAHIPNHAIVKKEASVAQAA